MDDAWIAAQAARLKAALQALDNGDDLGRDAQATVTLDQQSVGRLSRQDALLSQSMARATQARRDIDRRRIGAALRRISEGDYGFCAECGEEIARKRLEFDPAAPLCLDCASG